MQLECIGCGLTCCSYIDGMCADCDMKEKGGTEEKNISWTKYAMEVAADVHGCGADYCQHPLTKEQRDEVNRRTQAERLRLEEKDSK